MRFLVGACRLRILILALVSNFLNVIVQKSKYVFFEKCGERIPYGPYVWVINPDGKILGCSHQHELSDDLEINRVQNLIAP